MKSASGALINFMQANRAFYRANLYTFVLPGGVTKFYTGATVDVTVNGQVYAAAPCISDEGVSCKLGTAVASVHLQISADDRYTINGIPLLTFAKRNGFDGAVINLGRAVYDSIGGTLVGAYTRFVGRFSEAQDVGESQCAVIVNSFTELFDTDMPTDVYQAPCANTVFDAKCGLNRASFAATGAINGASTVRQLATNLAGSAGVYNLGSVVFTSGPNAGLRRTISTQDASGNLLLVAPLLAAPGIGDAFTVYPGCDLSMGTCAAKFNNLGNFRGEPFIPVAETAV